MLQDVRLSINTVPAMFSLADQRAGIDPGEAALLALADPGLDSRITLIGPDTLELLCVLLRRGCTSVSAMRLNDRPLAGTADVAVIPHMAAPEHLCRAVAHARRVLTPLGTIAVHVPAGLGDQLVRDVCQGLLLHGFGAVQSRDCCGDTLLRAELPLHGRIACA